MFYVFICFYYQVERSQPQLELLFIPTENMYLSIYFTFITVTYKDVLVSPSQSPKYIEMTTPEIHPKEWPSLPTRHLNW